MFDVYILCMMIPIYYDDYSVNLPSDILMKIVHINTLFTCMIC